MPEHYGSQPQVSIDGTVLDESVMPSLIRTVIDTQVHLPDMFVLHFHDPKKDIVTRARLKFGAQVVVMATAKSDGHEASVVTGEITAFEQHTDATGTSVIVRGYDPTHRLCRGRQTRTFADVTDADIVRQVAGGAGLQLGTIEDDGITHEYITQANLTDFDFLRARAHESGHELASVDGKLHWRTPTQSSTAPGGAQDAFAPPEPFQLLQGRDIIRFHPRVTAAEQVSEVQVRGWDPVQKQAIVGSAQAAAASSSVGVKPGELASMFSAAPYVVVNQPVSSQSEADAVAAAVAEQIAGAHAEAEATAYGDPRLVPGTAVTIGNVGWPHDGSYVLTTSRHVFDGEGFHTEFTCSGGQERSLLGLASIGATKGSHRGSGPPVYGLCVGQVSDISDPDNQFRVRVSLPWLADNYTSWWCRVAQPGAGNQRGLVWLPEVGDEVLVGFEHGDTRVPFVVGGLYNGQDTAPLGDQIVDSGTGEVKLRALVSRTNHRLVLTDDDSTSNVLLTTGDGNLKITMDTTQTSITIDSSGTVTISGSQGVTVKSDSDISLQAGGSLSLSGSSGVKIDGGPQVAVTGSIIKLN
jgi:uncharacterized protein involved in type VI secretion and phage assembly